MAGILVISDAHGNLHALRAVLEAARGWDELVVLEDLVDYGPRPAEVIDEPRSLGARIVRGNHDHAVGYGVDCRCGEATHWLNVWFRENITLRLLDNSQRRLLAQLPTRLEFDSGPIRMLAVHAAPADPLYAYLYPWLSNEDACRLLQRPSLRLARQRKAGEAGDGCPAGLYLVGHTHHQFYRVAHGATIVNPGSVGQPRNGDPGQPTP